MNDFFYERDQGMIFWKMLPVQTKNGIPDLINMPTSMTHAYGGAVANSIHTRIWC